MTLADTIGFDPFSDAFNEDPFPVYQRMRTETPALPFRHNGSNYWILTRYADIAHALKTWQEYTARKGVLIEDSPARSGHSLGTTDPPRHDQLRRVYNRAFTPGRIKAAENAVRDQARALARACVERGSFDLVADFAKPIFNDAIGRFIGFDADARIATLAIMEEIYSETTSFGPPIKFDALPLLTRHIVAQVSDHGIEGDSLIAVLRRETAGDSAIEESEVAHATGAVMLAGYSTAIHFLGNLVSVLDTNPHVLRAFRDDLSMAPKVVEEGARYDSAGHAFARSAATNLQVGGEKIAEGERIVLVYASANRDSEVIEDADAFLPTRKPVRHFGFGGGPHFCLGAPLARSLVTAVIGELVAELPMEFGLDRKSARRPINISSRGFERLTVTCG